MIDEIPVAAEVILTDDSEPLRKVEVKDHTDQGLELNDELVKLEKCQRLIAEERSRKFDEGFLEGRESAIEDVDELIKDLQNFIDDRRDKYFDDGNHVVNAQAMEELDKIRRKAGEMIEELEASN